MRTEKISIGGIPAIVWGEPSRRAYIHVHGKMSCKEFAEGFARIADEKGWQTVSFDLPEHGERRGTPDRCDVWNGMRDLNIIAEYAFERWETVAEYACSLGAYFSLNAYPERNFQKVLFQSPIVDMQYLVGKMFEWFGVTEEKLREAGEIPTPVDTLSWKYYCYIREHPVKEWSFPTSVLHGGLDNMQTTQTVEKFCVRFGATLTEAAQSEHPFMAPQDASIVEKWMRENI